MKKLLLLLFPVVVCFSTVFAQDKDTLKAEDILNMSFSDLMNTKVVSASKMEQQIKNVSATVQVITAEQIRDRSYLTLEEALGDLPGFQFRNIVGFNSYVFMRGAPSQNNLVSLLVDGVKIHELNSGGFYSGGQFNMSNIDRIEVVYGPASAIYGTNAVSGIVNVITKSAEANKKAYLSLLGGNFKTGMVNFGLQNYYANKNTGFAISGMYKTSEKADLRGLKADNNWSDEMENFENDISLSAKFKLKNFLAGVVYQEKRASRTTSTIDKRYLDKNTLWDIMFINGFLKYTNESHKRWAFSSMLYYRNSTLKPNSVGEIVKATDTSSGYQVGYYRPSHLVGFENQFNYRPNQRLTITGGLLGTLEQLSDGISLTHSNSQNTSPPKPKSPEKIDNNLVCYYIQGNYNILSKLSLTLGYRHDFSNYYGTVFTPRTGIVFNTNRFTAKLLYNTAFRAPKPWDYHDGLGNDDLNHERMKSYELFLSYSILNNLSFGTSVYLNKIHDILTKENINGNYRWVNGKELNTLGLDFYTNYTFENISAYVNYTFTNSYENENIQIPEISKHMANAGISYSFSSHIKANLRVNYIGARDNPKIIPFTGDNKIRDAFVINVTISYYDFKGFDFQIKLNNILDEVYYHTSNQFAGRYRQPQRSVYLMVTYNLFR